MTTTTKIFVVLMCLFAFIFTPMAIQFAARTEGWKTEAETQRQGIKAAVAREQATQAVLHAREADWQRQFSDDQRRYQDAQQQLAKLQQDVDNLTQQRDQLARSREMLETQAAILTADLASKSKHNDELGTAREKALGRERELQTASAWLTDQLQLRQADVSVLKQQLNQRQQEMLACRAENEELRKAAHLGKAGEPLTATPSGNVEPQTPPSRSKITGKVKEVSGKLVSIDVGSASGIREGMKMVIRRNGKYVGDIKIKSAAPGEAVGEIGVLGSDGRQVSAGDDVQDEISFLAG